MPHNRDYRRFWLAAALASLAAVGLGCAAMSAAGVSPGIWLRNLAAWLVGLAAAALLCRATGRVTALIVIGASILGLVACFLDAGQLGVHRWIKVGPLRIHMGSLLLPACLAALARLGPSHRLISIPVAAIALLLWLQPDAAQATAFAAGAGVVLRCLMPRRAVGMLTTALVACVAVATWFRPDPLQPVAEVEEIIGLAWNVAPALAVIAVAALAVSVMSPLLLARTGSAETRAAAMGLSAYLTVAAVAPAAGAFPVPLVGLGMSPIIGFWLGVAMLADSAP